MGTAASGIFLAIMRQVRRWPKGLSCMPACQMETFSAFQVSTGPTRDGLGGDQGDIAAAGRAGVLGDGERMQIDDAGGELAIFCGRGRSVFVFAFAAAAGR